MKTNWMHERMNESFNSPNWCWQPQERASHDDTFNRIWHILHSIGVTAIKNVIFFRQTSSNLDQFQSIRAMAFWLVALLNIDSWWRFAITNNQDGTHKIWKPINMNKTCLINGWIFPWPLCDEWSDASTRTLKPEQWRKRRREEWHRTSFEMITMNGIINKI